MEINLVKTEKLQTPTIVKIGCDFYFVSKKFYPESLTDKGDVRHIAINMDTGEWFDWGADIECLNLDMETFPKGTHFVIDI